MKILFFGDIFGKPGRNAVKAKIGELKQRFDIDITIANGENLADGRGLTQGTALEMFDAGIDVFTSGNHLWDKKESLDFIRNEKRILRPINYPPEAFGNEYFFVEKEHLSKKLCVVSLMGQAFIPNTGYSFLALKYLLPELEEQTNCILVDFHAESTAEKRALGFMFDGYISAMVGTHTHIQTADEEILPKGTGYITDVGMTGPHDSVIGVKKEIIIQKMTTGMPLRYDTANSGLEVNAVVIEINEVTGKTTQIIRIKEKIND